MMQKKGLIIAGSGTPLIRLKPWLIVFAPMLLLAVNWMQTVGSKFNRLMVQTLISLLKPAKSLPPFIIFAMGVILMICLKRFVLIFKKNGGFGPRHPSRRY